MVVALERLDVGKSCKSIAGEDHSIIEIAI